MAQIVNKDKEKMGEVEGDDEGKRNGRAER